MPELHTTLLLKKNQTNLRALCSILTAQRIRRSGGPFDRKHNDASKDINFWHKVRKLKEDRGALIHLIKLALNDSG